MRWKDVSQRYESRLDELRRSDPYQVLGVPKNVTHSELKAAYRRKMATYHPDRAHAFMKDHAGEVAKILNTSYQSILKDRGFE